MLFIYQETTAVTKINDKTKTKTLILTDNKKLHENDSSSENVKNDVIKIIKDLIISHMGDELPKLEDITKWRVKVVKLIGGHLLSNQ